MGSRPEFFSGYNYSTVCISAVINHDFIVLLKSLKSSRTNYIREIHFRTRDRRKCLCIMDRTCTTATEKCKINDN